MVGLDEQPEISGGRPGSVRVHRSACLKAEDRPDFEQVLDQALDSSRIRQALRHTEEDIDAERLRARALRARFSIAATAIGEYRYYVHLRTSSGQPAGSDSVGRGLLGALAVLTPALGGVAAVVFLLLGYGLHAVNARYPLADGLVTAGWVSAAVAALAAVLGLTGVLVSAMRNRAADYAVRPSDPSSDHPSDAAPRAGHATALDPAVTEARDAWRQALLERGVVPYLLRQLGHTGADEAVVPTATPTSSPSPSP
ncbi:hypothetical protein ACFU99_21890 [Streptomyces sp. NPDC057654]|uniref:hypothetical protein n=1 Tax=Streptomyces sp. NPDC057654 TaxID=3346196 RepID=UPI00369F1E62